MSEMRLGIVIVTYNSADSITACLTSIGTKHLSSVVVVDNASTDCTLDHLRDFPQVHVRRNHANLGYSRAANLGVASVQCELLCFLNPDCEVPDGLFDLAQSLYRKNSRSCLVPRDYTGNGPSTPGKLAGYTRLRLLLDIIFGNYHRPAWASYLQDSRTLNNTQWYWPHGACFFISKAFLEELGGMNERYTMYMVDVDLGQRIYQNGGEIAVLPFSVIHREGTGSGISNLQRLRLLNEGRITFAKNTFGLWYALVLRILAWPGYTLRKLIQR